MSRNEPLWRQDKEGQGPRRYSTMHSTPPREGQVYQLLTSTLIVDVLRSLTVCLSFLVEAQWKLAPILSAPRTWETHILRSALSFAGEDPVTLQERLAACFEKPSK